MAMSMSMHAMSLEQVAKLTDLEALKRGEAVDDLDLFPQRYDCPEVWSSPRIGWFNDFWGREIGIQRAYMFTKQQIADMLVKAREYAKEEYEGPDPSISDDKEFFDYLNSSYDELEKNIKDYDESTHGFIGVIY